MPVYRFRSIEDMPPPWRNSGDPGNLRAVGEMLALYRRLSGADSRLEPGVTRFASVEEMKARREDPHRPEDRLRARR